MASIIGQELGGYRIISQVGKGGMATVYKAFQASLDRYVAVKVMPPYYAQEDETFIKRFKREAQSIAKLRHPNILLVIDFGEHDNLIYIVMEFVDAGTLTDRLGMPMPNNQAVKILDQIASALDYAHMQGLVHRDVKPSNILLPKPDWPLLTDFGLAKIVGGSQLTLTGTIAGTPAYMSPEQGQGESVDSRSDIYSLGLVLYEMMTGGVPYTAETPMAVVVKHIIDPLPLPTTKNPNIPEPVERVILKALAKNPEDRYQRATELSQAFFNALRESASIAEESPTVLDEVESEPVVETVVDSVGIEVPAVDSVTSVDSVPPADKVVTERPPAEIFPEGLHQVESTPDVSPSKPAMAGTGLMQQRPWLKWFLPAGAATAALCAIAMLIAFVIVPGIRDNLGTVTEIPSTLTAEDLMLEGHHFYEAQDYDAAILAYESAISQGEQDPEMFFSLAYSYREQGQVEEALRVLDRVVRTYPEEPWVHATAGHVYNEIEFFYEAITQFEIALELDPADDDIREELAATYESVGEYPKAEEIRAQGGKPQPQGDPDVLDEQGWEHLYNGDYDEAEEAFLAALDISPELLSAWDGLSDVYWYQDDIDRAIDALQQALEYHEQDSYLYERLGWLYYFADDFNGAEQAFNNAVLYDSSSYNAWDGLAEVYWAMGDLEGAIDVLETAIANNPENDLLYEKLGFVHWDNWNYEAAIDAMENDIALNTDWAFAYSSLADIYYELGEMDHVIEVLERGVTENPERSDLFENLGWYYVEIGNYEASAEAFQNSIAVSPDYGWPYIGLANVYTVLGDWEGANEALINADTYSYEDPWILESIGWGYADLGDCPTANSYFNRSLAQDPSIEGSKDGLEYCAN